MIDALTGGDIAGPIPTALQPIVPSLLELIEVAGKMKASST
ncbi:MAG: hypothetical protein WCH04_21545 [Gammaproteobacteria bacterium]